MITASVWTWNNDPMILELPNYNHIYRGLLLCLMLLWWLELKQLPSLSLLTLKNLKNGQLQLLHRVIMLLIDPDHNAEQMERISSVLSCSWLGYHSAHVNSSIIMQEDESSSSSSSSGTEVVSAQEAVKNRSATYLTPSIRSHEKQAAIISTPIKKRPIRKQPSRDAKKNKK